VIKEFLSRYALLRRAFLVLVIYYCFHAVPLEIKASRMYREVAQWPVAEASVLSASVTVTRFSWSPKSNRFCPDMEYSYSVAGKKYTTRNRVFDFGCWPDAYRFVAKHQPGTSILIAYDPTNPMSTIVPSSVSDTGFPWGDVLGGTLLVLVLMGDIFLARRES
jgi:hypothetical protein